MTGVIGVFTHTSLIGPLLGSWASTTFTQRRGVRHIVGKALLISSSRQSKLINSRASASQPPRC
jgi:hypothetical protein